MSDSIIVEQATRLIAQIIDDYERLQSEFLNLNIEKVLEGNPAIYGAMSLTALNNIKTQTQTAFTFLESMRLAELEKND